MSETLTRRVDVRPGYDLRTKGPRNYGIGGCHIVFYVIGSKGAIQCVIMTDWYPSSARNIDRLPIQANKPWISDIGCHAREPQYKSHRPMKDCHIITDGQCFYDGTSLNEAWEEGLVNAGSDWLWPRLEALYRHQFEGGEYPDLSYEPVPYPRKESK